MIKRGLRITLSFVLAALFLYLFFRKLHIGQVVRYMGQADFLWLAVAVGFQLVHLTLRSYRWRILLTPMKGRIGFYNLFSTTSVGYLISFAFFRVGEVLRPLMLAQREGISKSSTVATCVLERLMDFLSVAFLFGVYLIFLFDPPAAGTGALDMHQVRQGGLLFGAVTLAAFPALYLMVHFRHRLFHWLDAHPSLSGSFLPRLLHSFMGGFDAVKSGWVFVLAWMQSIAIWLVITGSIWASLKAFDLPIGFADSLLMMGLLSIGIAVPTPGGVGSYEYAGQLGLEGVFGVEANRAAATILVTHAFAIAPVILIGLALLWREGLDIRSLLRITREAEAGGQLAASDKTPRVMGASR
ncbi:MAG TPA: lysylphosphatidylglycerol synthase transmembrane domain-containing protein [Candidatus Polarisedimenticolia bacterium]|jgi:hypothetical protein